MCKCVREREIERNGEKRNGGGERILMEKEKGSGEVFSFDFFGIKKCMGKENSVKSV